MARLVDQGGVPLLRAGLDGVVVGLDIAAALPVAEALGVGRGVAVDLLLGAQAGLRAALREGQGNGE